MKSNLRTLKALALLSLIASGFGTMQAAVIYSENFDNNATVGGPKFPMNDANGVGWVAEINNTGPIGVNGGTSASLRSGNSSLGTVASVNNAPTGSLPGFINGQINAGGLMLMSTSEYSFSLSTSTLTSVSWDTQRVGNGANTGKFAINVAGNWYANTDALGATGWANGSIPIDYSSASWNSFTISGSGIVLGSNIALPTTGAVNSFGVLVNYGADGTNGSEYRIDNFQVNATAVPEPSVVWLGALGCIGLVLLRRSRGRFEV